ncbi:Phosphorylase b kinase regulatory subunit alpha, liver isoform [Liparis tanakae]|uniref:Phosphorylase b kinase regulatory subunit alpha, liver isoform n=1 Tax=Liparis tanakae TaxID=230148 RepID=A0A4Z2FL70_9TELE|nr:Phosphorylase b kinase regulatory subunit alpha, liver isoform [Liparis tanakae]
MHDVDVDSIGGIVHVDRILHLTNDLFLSDQGQRQLTARGTFEFEGMFIATSGSFGTMTYLSKAVITYVQDFLPSSSCLMQ